MKTILLTFRRIKKNQTAMTFGIGGLVVGLVCLMYIFFWVTDEISYDRFHAKLDRIFVVHAYLEGGPRKVTFSGCPPAVGTALKDEYPEVENTCRYIPAYQKFFIAYGKHKYMEKTAFSDYSLFDIFSFPFIYGDAGEANTPNRIILTRTTASKYFGNANPVGKLVRFDNRIDLTVAGVIKDIPHNSTITFDAIIPLENIINLYNANPNYLSTWNNNGFITFGLLTGPGGYYKVASSITRRIQKEIPESTNYLRTYKFKDLYLYEQGHIRNVRIFSMIALLVLLAATLNFINLSTARSFNQSKETGLRKTLGASRFSLVRLVYSDTALISFLAFSFAFVAALVGLPLFNQAVGKSIDYPVLFSWRPLIALILVYLLTVLLAGSYPAFFLSKFSPFETLGSNFQTVKNRGIFRNSMVVAIFLVSIVLLASTLVISKQTRFMRQMDLGFEKDQLVYVTLKGKLKDQYSALKEEIGRSSNVLSSSVVSNLPNMINNNGDGLGWEGKDPNFKPLITFWGTDEDLAKTLGTKMIEGNFFDKNQEGVVINKELADMIGWDSFVGKSLKDGGNLVPILGVMNDIHYNSLREETRPMVIMQANWANNYLIIKVNTGQIEKTLKYIQGACKSIEPEMSIDYGFVNDEYAKMLAAEIKLGKLVGIFSGFAIMVLCLGMLGFVMFLAEQKTKEIGIRKCMGEQVASIVGRFLRPFLYSGIIAGIIAIPVTWFIMDRWLRDYAYRIHISIWIFLAAVFTAIALALLTVSWQSWKAATRNPVETLRYE